MSMNRVQKLLFSEYCDFEDMVLIESPFAQTTKEGNGVRQVHIGLTPSKLILATDILPSLENHGTYSTQPIIDPEIETFELIAIYPVECVTLSVYRKKRRQALKARFCNNRVWYFELGGFEKRGMFWNLWCERVKFLCPPLRSDTSVSETSVATSTTTASSLYLLEKKVVAVNGLRQVWCKFGPNFGIDTRYINDVLSRNGQSLARKWTDRHLYLGEEFQQNVSDYEPIVNFPTKDEFFKPPKRTVSKRRSHATLMNQHNLHFGDTVLVNRFASGVDEKCKAGLYLPLKDYILPNVEKNCSTLQSLASIQSGDFSVIDFEELANAAVFLWELLGYKWTGRSRMKHRRRYGLAPKPVFLYGLGPWTLSKGDRYSCQIKRACSEVSLRSPELDSDLKLLVSRRQLTATVSCPNLMEFENSYSGNNIVNAPKRPVILFWTPNYWYRPVSAKDAYTELRQHLKKLRKFQESRKKCKRRKINGKKKNRQTNSFRSFEDETDEDYKFKRKKQSFISHMFRTKIEEISNVDLNEHRKANESSFQYLKRMLKFETKMTGWNLDSTTMAQQLTLIDKDLFLKVPPCELKILLYQKSCRNAPNIAAIVTFSHRISCLLATEILKNESERYRARLIARFINLANKCHSLSNFQSCRTVLSGLQNPAIFRLRDTWAYLRKKHASKYQVFEFLCRLYRDPRMPSYQKTFYIFSQNAPFLPYIGHLIAKLLDKIPEYRIFPKSRSVSRQASFCTKTTSSPSSIHQSISPDKTDENLFSKLFKVLLHPSQETAAGDVEVKSKKNKRKRKSFTKLVTFKGLHEYFRPLNFYENNSEQLLNEVTELLEKSQLGALHYNFEVDQITRDFLLKARYDEDETSFFNSLCIEPAKHTKLN